MPFGAVQKSLPKALQRSSVDLVQDLVVQLLRQTIAKAGTSHLLILLSRLKHVVGHEHRIRGNRRSGTWGFRRLKAKQAGDVRVEGVSQRRVKSHRMLGSVKAVNVGLSPFDEPASQGSLDLSACVGRHQKEPL